MIWSANAGPARCRRAKHDLPLRRRESFQFWLRDLQGADPKPRQPPFKTGFRYPSKDAGVAQLAEQLFCKQQVIGSIPFAGSMEK